MELAALINAILIVGAFVLGMWYAERKGRGERDVLRDQCETTQEQNRELLGTLYARVGYTPKRVVSSQKAEVGSQKQEAEAIEEHPEPPRSPFTQASSPFEIPNIYARRDAVFKRMAEARAIINKE